MNIVTLPYIIIISLFFCRWFNGFDWEGLNNRKLQPPIVPKVTIQNTNIYKNKLFS